MRLKAVCHGSVKRAGGSREGPGGIRRAAGPRVRPCRATGAADFRKNLRSPPYRPYRATGGLSMGPGAIPDPRYSGRVMVKTVCSGVDSQEIWPPCATTISLAMARPSPAPPRLVARAASSR